MKEIAIYGAGGFGREVELLIKDINKVRPEYEVIGYLDDSKRPGELVNGKPILGGIEYLNSVDKPLCIALSIADPKIRQAIVDQTKNPLISFPTLIHPNCVIGDDRFIHVGKGCIICAGSIVTVNIKIKDFVIINLMCTVGHDTVIEDFCSFMPSVNISGEVHVEKGVYVGTGAKIINQIEIGDNTIIGAGAVVTKSLPSSCTAVGVPAKVIKINN